MNTAAIRKTTVELRRVPAACSSSIRRGGAKHDKISLAAAPWDIAAPKPEAREE